MIQFINEAGAGKAKVKEIKDLIELNSKAKNLRKDGLYLIHKGYIFSIIKNSQKETSGAFFLDYPTFNFDTVNEFLKNTTIVINGVGLNKIIKTIESLTISDDKATISCLVRKTKETINVKIDNYKHLERQMIKEMIRFIEKYGEIEFCEEIDITDKVNRYFKEESLFDLLEMPNGNKIKLSKKMVKNIGSKYSENRKFYISSGLYLENIYLTRISTFEDGFVTKSYYLNINF